MDPLASNQKRVAELAGPRMPADHGLSSLGLLMQLGGTLALGVMVIVAIMPVFAHDAGDAFLVFVVGASGAVRSAFHRAAGTALLYGSSRGHLRPTMIYIVTAVAQSALTLLVINKVGDLPLAANLTIGFLLLSWPAALFVLLRTPRLARMAGGIPPAEDMGFEGAAVLMCLFGVAGILVTSLYLYALAKLSGGLISRPDGMLLAALMAMLLIRSVLHVMAGVKGTRGIDSDGATESASRYYTFGIIASVIAGGALFILMMMGRSPGEDMLAVVLAVHALLAWPLLLRRFYVERNFSALLAGAEAPSFRRAPDAGLTALGWLLLATALLGLSVSVPAAIFDTSTELTQLVLLLSGLGPGPEVTDAIRSPWWSVGLWMTQLWAAIELVNMTDRYRLAATIYGAVASIVTIYLTLPGLEALGAMRGDLLGGGVFFHMKIAIWLVLPVGTLLLANRTLLPTARARVRTSDDRIGP